MHERIILFDGVCNLCNGTVNFVIAHDRAGAFRFAALQSGLGGEALHRHGLTSTESIVLLEGNRAHTRSTAALRIARGLGFPWSLAWALMLFPGLIRDTVYDWVARNRYRWFGRREECRVATPETQGRFLA